MRIEIPNYVRFYPVNGGRLCFRHAVARALAGEHIRTETDTEYPFCDDCDAEAEAKRKGGKG